MDRLKSPPTEKNVKAVKDMIKVTIQDIRNAAENNTRAAQAFPI
jgi:hypothetical protein